MRVGTHKINNIKNGSFMVKRFFALTVLFTTVLVNNVDLGPNYFSSVPGFLLVAIFYQLYRVITNNDFQDFERRPHMNRILFISQRNCMVKFKGKLKIFISGTLDYKYLIWEPLETQFNPVIKLLPNFAKSVILLINCCNALVLHCRISDMVAGNRNVYNLSVIHLHKK